MLDLWRMYGAVDASEWRCKSAHCGGAGECLGCPADQGEACQRDRVEAQRPKSERPRPRDVVDWDEVL